MTAMYTRQRLKIRQASSSAASGDTGPAFFGELLQMRWLPTVGDSGAGLLVSLIDAPRPPAPKRGPSGTPDDTGTGSIGVPNTGWLFYNREDGLGAASYTRAPRLPVSDLDGFDTGAATVHRSVPIVSAGQCLRVKSVPAGNGAVAGDILFWIKN